MKLFLYLGLLVSCFLITSIGHSSISQHRKAGESYKHASNRVTSFIPKKALLRENPFNKKVPIRQVDYSLVPKVTTYDELIHMYNVVRDSRFLYEEDKPDFARRISWLYPDDGCYSRAAMTGIKLEQEHLVRPAKIFAFGDLMIQTPYSTKGVVYWWYHVAAAVNYMGSIYVIDPALKSDGPILVDEWYSKMGAADTLTAVVCSKYTYDPLDFCVSATAKNDALARRDQAKFLGLEWVRVIKLGYEAKEILGDVPPWN